MPGYMWPLHQSSVLNALVLIQTKCGTHNCQRMLWIRLQLASAKAAVKAAFFISPCNMLSGNHVLSLYQVVIPWIDANAGFSYIFISFTLIAVQQAHANAEAGINHSKLRCITVQQNFLNFSAEPYQDDAKGEKKNYDASVSLKLCNFSSQQNSYLHILLQISVLIYYEKLWHVGKVRKVCEHSRLFLSNYQSTTTNRDSAVTAAPRDSPLQEMK